mgnify:CR=1 FL=1
MKIDSHHHLWQYSSTEYGWIDDSMPVLKANFLNEELQSQLKANDIQGSVVVQARQSMEETRWLCEIAQSSNVIKGVVGWIDLLSDNLEQELLTLKTQTKLKGFRHVLQGENDADFMANPKFIHGLTLLEKHDFSYDLLIFANQLPAAINMLSQVPNLRVVIDHIAKPDIKTTTGFKQWQQGMAQLAENPNVYCKISGLVTEADWDNWQPEDFTPYLNSVMTLFGPHRVMFGSDWPVCLLAATYAEVKSITQTGIETLSQSDQDNVFGHNAVRFYQLDL